MGLRAEGWRPVPFREFIVKIHSRCDLSCDYCYMYEMADQSWRDQPRRMSAETAEWTARRIGEHAREPHALNRGRADPARRRAAPRRTRAYRPPGERPTRCSRPGVRVDVGIQTNAVGLDDAYLRLFSELGIRVGVSLGGIGRRTTGTAGSPAGEAATRRSTPACIGSCRRPSGTCSADCCARSTCATIRSLPTKLSPPSNRPRSTSCSRTGPGRRRRPGGCQARSRRRTRTG